MRTARNVVVAAGLATAASAHSVERRGTVPVDGNIIYSCTVPGTVALTFDDGPYIYSQSIVDQLTKAGHRATFFQNGMNYGDILTYGPLLNSMIAGGHQIGSHTYQHKDLATLDAAGITDQMLLLEADHLQLIGKAPTYMRPPYLSTNDLVTTTLKGLGFKIISIDIDTFDYNHDDATIALSISWYEGNQTAGGTLSLNHDPYQHTATDFVPAIIAYLDGKGLKSVPVGECLGDDPVNWYRTGSASVSVSAVGSPTASVSVSVPAPSGNGTAPTGPSGPGKPSPTYGHGGRPTPTGWQPGKGCGGGDTEPGHGENAGRGSLPGHKGEGNKGWSGYSSTGSNGTSSGHASTTGAIAPNPSYYVNSATSFAASAIIIGAATLAFFL